MQKLMAELKTQYWLWFIRDKLIDYELEDIANNKGQLSIKLLNKVDAQADFIERRKRALMHLKQQPTKSEVYSKERLANWIFELSECQKSANKFSDNGDDFKNGKIPIPLNTVTRLNETFPRSESAYKCGPNKLFVIIEEQSLPNAAVIIAKELLKVLKSCPDELEKDTTLNELKKRLANKTKASIFGGIIRLLNSIEDIFDYLFPNNDWNKFEPTLSPPNSHADGNCNKHLRNPIRYSLKEVAPILIGFAFFKAKFFDEVHYLAKICYDESYLNVLQESFLISERLWRFEKTYKDSEAAINCGESLSKRIFQRAYMLANPSMFHEKIRDPNDNSKLDEFREQFLKEINELVDLDELGDDTGT